MLQAGISKRLKVVFNVLLFNTGLHAATDMTFCHQMLLDNLLLLNQCKFIAVFAVTSVVSISQGSSPVNHTGTSLHQSRTCNCPGVIELSNS